jgi:hypothetical protein
MQKHDTILGQICQPRPRAPQMTIAIELAQIQKTFMTAVSKLPVFRMIAENCSIHSDAKIKTSVLWKQIDGSDDTTLWRLLINARWPRGIRCRHCGTENFAFVRGGRVVRCRKCGSQEAVASNTLLSRTHLPIKIWFQCISALTVAPDLSASHLAGLLGLRRRQTAMRMKQSLAQLCSKRTPSSPIEIAEFLVRGDVAHQASNAPLNSEKCYAI